MNVPTRVRATFLGTSTIYLDDGSSGVLVDGFFSRPSLIRVALGRVRPHQRRITSALSRAGIARLDALLVAHSHHDHAMDAPEIIKRLGGVMHGSESSLNIGRGAGLAEASMAVLANGTTIRAGAFSIEVFRSTHSPGNRYPGTIDRPLVSPSRASSYRDGGCYSFHVTHPAGTLLIHPSANVIPHQFDGLDVDALYLGVGAVGSQTREFQDDYWRHVVSACNAEVILPIHWDNFFRGLDRPLRPLPAFLDKFDQTKAWLDRKSSESGVRVRFQDPYEVIDPFA